MRTTQRSPGGVVLALALLASPGLAAQNDEGGLLGWVEDTRGTPVAGAVISLFGRSPGGSGLVTLSDSAGRFFVPRLPAGSYTVRALRDGHIPAPARQITVLPDRDSMFTLSLTAIGEVPPSIRAGAAFESVATAKRELRWLLRHKRRSVLEARQAGPGFGASDPQATPDAPRPAGLDATLELRATPAAMGMSSEDWGEAQPSSFSLVRLDGRLDWGRWSLGGLVSESEGATWRMAAEFVLEQVEGHEVAVGTGYGTRFLRPAVPRDRQGRLDNRSVGAVFVQDRWQASEKVAATLGGRFSYIGFVEDSNRFDSSVAVEFSPSPQARVTAAVSSRTLAPGGDLLTLSTLGAAPAIAFAVMGENLRPERALRFELGVEESVGSATLRAHTFFESVHDQLANAYEGPRASRSLRIFNAGATASRGLTLSLGRRFGDALSGSLCYTYGHTARRAPLRAEPGRAVPAALSYDQGGFHDLVARVEAVIDESDTRLAAFYRINSLLPELEGRSVSNLTSTRFDVQLSQGLPFLGTLTRADWDLLLAVRNLYYETTEGAALDELAVLNPPKRVLGGVSVRF